MPGDIAIRPVCWFVCLFVRSCACVRVRVFVNTLYVFGLNISKTVKRYKLGYNGAPIGNGIWQVEW